MRLLFTLVAFVLLVPAAAGKPPPAPTEAAVVKTGKAPCGLATHRGELWVGVYEAGAVLRLDRAGRVRQRLRIGRFACRLAVDDRAVWVTRDQAGSLVRIDRRSGRRRAIRVPSPFDVIRAAGGIWVTSFETGTVSRIDPASARVTRTYDVGGHPAGIAWCAGRIWVGHGRGATRLTAIDPRTRRVRQVDVVMPSPGWPRCLRGQLWATTADGVIRVGPRSGHLLFHLPLGGTPADVAAAPTGIGPEDYWMVWVTDKERSLVHRIDQSSGRVVDSFAAGPGAYALAAFGGSMWVTSFAGVDVRRYDTCC
jgi:streptogramin lyase